MAWTGITRRQYQREGLRYASDTTDARAIAYGISRLRLASFPWFSLSVATLGP